VDDLRPVRDAVHGPQQRGEVGGSTVAMTGTGASARLRYREPAFSDALLMTYPDFAQLVPVAHAATTATEDLLHRGTAAGVVHEDFTVDNLYCADVHNGLALRALPLPWREDYDHRTRSFVDSHRLR
jgi:hypothetical protein